MLTQEQAIKLLEQPGWTPCAGNLIKGKWLVRTDMGYCRDIEFSYDMTEVGLFIVSKVVKKWFSTEVVIDEQHPVRIAYKKAFDAALDASQAAHNKYIAKKLKEAGIE